MKQIWTGKGRTQLVNASINTNVKGIYRECILSEYKLISAPPLNV